MNNIIRTLTANPSYKLSVFFDGCGSVVARIDDGEELVDCFMESVEFDDVSDSVYQLLTEAATQRAIAGLDRAIGNRKAQSKLNFNEALAVAAVTLSSQLSAKSVVVEFKSNSGAQRWLDLDRNGDFTILHSKPAN